MMIELKVEKNQLFVKIQIIEGFEKPQEIWVQVESGNRYKNISLKKESDSLFISVDTTLTELFNPSKKTNEVSNKTNNTLIREEQPKNPLNSSGLSDHSKTIEQELINPFSIENILYETEIAPKDKIVFQDHIMKAHPIDEKCLVKIVSVLEHETYFVKILQFTSNCLWIELTNEELGKLKSKALLLISKYKKKPYNRLTSLFFFENRVDPKTVEAINCESLQKNRYYVPQKETEYFKQKMQEELELLRDK